MRLARDKKTMKISNYKIIERIYNRLFTKQSFDYRHALSYLLGRDKYYVIREAMKLPDRGGCYAMPSISGESMSRAMIKIFKKDLIPCGIARSGRFGGYMGDDERGTIMSQLKRMSKDAILLSFSLSGRCATLETPKYSRKKFNFYVVPNKRSERRWN